MKAEVYFLLITIVVLVAVGVYYFVKPKGVNFDIKKVTPSKEDEVVLGYNTDKQKAAAAEADANTSSGLDLGQNNSMAQQSQQKQQQQQPPTKAPSQSQVPAMQINPEKQYTATMTTSVGKIVLDLNAKQTPITVNNFVYLAKKGFYNDTIFHRVIKGFMIQGGDPTGTGAGGPGYKFEDEPFEGEYTRGTLAMANAGPDTNGSQFFIMHADAALPPNYTIFGKVKEGLETVDNIANAEVTTSSSGEKSKPVTPVKILSVEITESEPTGP